MRENRYFSRSSRFVKEYVEENNSGNLITDIHDSADAINDRLATIMNMDDQDFVITLTRYGLWIEWKKNRDYGVSVEAYGHSLSICGWSNKRIISRELCDADASRRELASTIDMLVMRDGKL